MPLNFPDVGENLVLDVIVNKVAAQNLVLKLFQNNITPADTDVASTYTEATFTGYSAINLTGANWNSASAGANSYNAAQSFTCSGAGSQTIYGYYVIQVTSLILLYSERDPLAPFTIGNVGDQVQITPAITAN